MALGKTLYKNYAACKKTTEPAVLQALKQATILFQDNSADCLKNECRHQLGLHVVNVQLVGFVNSAQFFIFFHHLQ